MDKSIDERQVPVRLLEYLRERFPLANALGAMILALSMASAVAGQVVGARPNDLPLAASALVVIGMFLIMRICDEFKDAEDDRRYRPERPVPRGLVSLSELRTVAMAIGVLQAVVVVLVSPGAWWMLVLTSVWIGLMTIEFGVGEWLKRQPALYLFSHMVSMPLIALTAMAIATSTEVLFSPVSWLLAGIAFVCGIALEIGRKVWDADNEREGVDTYSKVWGRPWAVFMWQLSFAALYMTTPVFTGFLAASIIASTLVFGLSVAFMVLTFWHFRNVKRHEPERLTQRMIEKWSAALVPLTLIVVGAAPWLP